MRNSPAARSATPGGASGRLLLGASKPGASSRASGWARIMPSRHSRTSGGRARSSTPRPKAKARASPSRSRRRTKAGVNASDTAPSPSRRRMRLGRRKATKKASAPAPAPRMYAVSARRAGRCGGGGWRHAGSSWRWKWGRGRPARSVAQRPRPGNPARFSPPAAMALRIPENCPEIPDCHPPARREGTAAILEHAVKPEYCVRVRTHRRTAAGVVISGGLYYAHVTGRNGPDEHSSFGRPRGGPHARGTRGKLARHRGYAA